MDEYMRNQVYSNLNMLDTAELVEIWQKHDTEEYTDLAFEVVKEILVKRLGELPPQDVEVEDEEEENEDEDELEDEIEGESEFEGESELEGEYEGEVKAGESSDKTFTCPYCQGEHVSMRAVELRGRGARLVLKRPRSNVEQLLGINEFDEIVALACEDCGYVFFMLRDFV